MRHLVPPLVVAVMLSPAASSAGQLDGTAPPVLPDTMSRAADGRVTIRAVRLMAPLRLDGQLDEELYATVRPAGGFIQNEPQPGATATEQTEVWLSFDRDNIYVSARCFDSQPASIIATEMRRDSVVMFQGNDIFLIALDTFYDRRNSAQFYVNPLGTRADGQTTNEGNYNGDWNPVWEIKAGRFPGGWTLEAAIPFKSLRYRPGASQVWGFNVGRVKRSKNEISFLTPMPAVKGVQAINMMSLAPTAIGIEVPQDTKHLDLKPYAISSVASDTRPASRMNNDLDADVGIDARYGLSQGLTADLTYNTDFAQVEADEQQVNLTRFSLFFPEKREFFLENQGTFAFGGVGTTGTTTGARGDVPILFYSRRIGLNQGRVVPLDAGGRVTGRVGRYTVGALNIETGAEDVSRTPATNFSVARLKRDILRKSGIGVMATGRSVSQSGRGGNVVYGADATFAFFDNLAINSYWARTRTDGLPARDDRSYRGQLDYTGDRYGVQIERLSVGNNFNPDAGFVRRYDIRRTQGLLRFSPRPKGSKTIRRYVWSALIDYVENGRGRLETRKQGAEFDIEFQNGDKFMVLYTDSYEFLPRAFPIAPDILLPVRGYNFGTTSVGFNLGQQRKVSANILVEHGTFYDGHATAVSVGRGRVNLSSHFSAEPSYSVNRVELAEGSFTTHLAGLRATFTMTPLMFTSALVQYNSTSHSVAANVRLRWEYRPGSELFVVLNEERDTLSPRFPRLANRAVIVKINRLIRF